MTPDHESVTAILEAYSRLPDTPHRPRRRDRCLARELVCRGIPRPVIEAALLLAVARRLRPGAARLPAIRSLHYFLPVIEEVLAEPLDPSYVDHLRRLMAAPLSQRRPARRSSTRPESPRQQALFPRDDQDAGASPKNSVFT